MRMRFTRGPNDHRRCTFPAPLLHRDHHSVKVRSMSRWRSRARALLVVLVVTLRGWDIIIQTLQGIKHRQTERRRRPSALLLLGTCDQDACCCCCSSSYRWCPHLCRAHRLFFVSGNGLGIRMRDLGVLIRLAVRPAVASTFPQLGISFIRTNLLSGRYAAFRV